MQPLDSIKFLVFGKLFLAIRYFANTFSRVVAFLNFRLTQKDTIDKKYYQRGILAKFAVNG